MSYLLAILLSVVAVAERTESGVVVTLPPGEYHNMWIRSGSVTETPEKLSENSWLVPWNRGTIGGVLCGDICTVFETQWYAPVKYLWIKIPLFLVAMFLLARLLARRLPIPWTYET